MDLLQDATVSVASGMPVVRYVVRVGPHGDRAANFAILIDAVTALDAARQALERFPDYQALTICRAGTDDRVAVPR